MNFEITLQMRKVYYNLKNYSKVAIISNIESTIFIAMSQLLKPNYAYKLTNSCISLLVILMET